MEQNISDDLITSENMPTTTVATVALQEQVSATPGVVIASSHRSGQWGIGPFRFRFRLEKFRPGRDLVERRFGIAEAAFLLMMAYLASRGLGVFARLYLMLSSAQAHKRMPTTLLSVCLICFSALSLVVRLFRHLFPYLSPMRKSMERAKRGA